MNEWLAARSFERAHEVISAINTLSMMRVKLSARGIADVVSGAGRSSRGKGCSGGVSGQA